MSWRSGIRTRGARGIAALLIALTLAVFVGIRPLVGGQASLAAAATPALVGFSFSPKSATYSGQDPTASLRTLLAELTPDLVRLPVYWDSVESTRGAFDFSQTDHLIALVESYNRAHAVRPARVILIAGLRNMGYPELYVPDWVPEAQREPASQLAVDPEYQRYLVETYAHYRRHPLLYSWQIENEPLDNVPTDAGYQVDIAGDDLQDEVEKVRSVDSIHPVVITTYNSATLSLDLAAMSPGGADPGSAAQPAGHPLEALQLGDVLGLDLYVVTGDTSLADANAHKRTIWKSRALDYWSGQAQALNKPLWITEMQGAPWPGMANFTTADLLFSASAYRRHGASVILLWGVENWLASDAWMQAGRQAREMLAA
jgi:hypothetical protein